MTSQMRSHNEIYNVEKRHIDAINIKSTISFRMHDHSTGKTFSTLGIGIANTHYHVYMINKILQ